ncbi:protein serine/threonine phosphatase 2C [Apiospora hydei]|uniref:Protein serine/threonine phosphatase 2C n=1 Tax=Apiospora hydei TaxID=1337664 RepID=A0ABR1WQF9_9PEZI
MRSPSPAIDASDSTRSDWRGWVISDGHGEKYTSEALLSRLPVMVARHIHGLANPSDVGQVIAALRLAFAAVDVELLQQARRVVQRTVAAVDMCVATAYFGAGAQLVLWDPKNRRLYVASVGRNRAVLARWDHTQPTAPATLWQTCETHSAATNQDEIERIQNLHPQREWSFLLRNNRLLGNLHTRSFGNYFWKCSVAARRSLLEYCHLPRMNLDALDTPPYVTAEPTVGVWEVTPVDNNRACLILGNTGLWERMDNHQAVPLVRRWKRDHPTAPNREAGNAAEHLVLNAFAGSIGVRAEMLAVVVFFDVMRADSNRVEQVNIGPNGVDNAPPVRRLQYHRWR